MEIIPIIPYIGVFFPFMGLLSLDRYHFNFLMILKETLTFLSLSNPVSTVPTIFNTWASDSSGFNMSCAVLLILARNVITSILSGPSYSHFHWISLCVLSRMDSSEWISQVSKLFGTRSIGRIESLRVSVSIISSFPCGIAQRSTSTIDIHRRMLQRLRAVSMWRSMYVTVIRCCD